MPKVACLAVAGVELWFNSNDHLPPHFHAEKSGEWEVRVFFLRGEDEMVEVVYSVRRRRPSKADLRELVDNVANHRADLLSEWETVVGVKAPGPER